jgi:PHP family Zn ribbon phosphoesterase
VHRVYEGLVQALGSEFEVLLEAPIPDVAAHSSERVGLGVERMRKGEVQAVAGYDGVFGVISVLPGAPNRHVTAEPGQQMGLF